MAISPKGDIAPVANSVDLVQDGVALKQVPDDRIWARGALLRTVANLDIRHMLPQVRDPTLVLHCWEDNAVPFKLGGEIGCGDYECTTHRPARPQPHSPGRRSRHRAACGCGEGIRRGERVRVVCIRADTQLREHSDQSRSLFSCWPSLSNEGTMRVCMRALHGFPPAPGTPDIDTPASLIRFADRLHAHSGLVVPFPFCSKQRVDRPGVSPRFAI
jgi:hypothetical protein